MAEASFRARKRQKVYRKRLDDDDEPPQSQQPALLSPSSTSAADGTADISTNTISAHAPSTVADDASSPSATATAPPMTTGEEGSGAPSVAEILRRARKQKARGLGVEFSSSSSSSRGGASSHAAAPEVGAMVAHTAPVAAPEENAAEALAAKRFAPQTGRVADTFDKHMMAYIDSKMAEMREGERAAAAAAAAAAAGINGTSQDTQGQKIAFSSSSAIPLDTHRERQPAGMGKLMEIDLGPEAAQRNIQRTEEATRRLQNGGSLDQVEEQLKGRRGRKRRTSEDIRRDKLVEEILKESRLEIYDDPDQQNETEGDEAADDRIVEQFRREFMEAVQTRNNRRPPASATAAKGKVDDRPKGPKLGGSRSARAAMRAMEEKQGKKK